MLDFSDAAKGPRGKGDRENQLLHGGQEKSNQEKLKRCGKASFDVMFELSSYYSYRHSSLDPPRFITCMWLILS